MDQLEEVNIQPPAVALKPVPLDPDFTESKLFK
jgi:hypothetical protein